MAFATPALYAFGGHNPGTSSAMNNVFPVGEGPAWRGHTADEFILSIIAVQGSGGNPTVAATSSGQPTTTSNPTINLPDNISTGDLLILYATHTDDTTTVAPTGETWTEIYDEAGGTVISSWCGYRVVDGTEGWGVSGNTTDLATGDSGSESWTYVCLRITGRTGTPEADFNNFDPGSTSDTGWSCWCGNVYPSWTGDTLFISVCTSDGTTTVTSPPMYGSATTVGGSGGQIAYCTRTQDVPDSTADGVIAVSFLGSDGVSTITGPTGWTKLDENNTGDNSSRGTFWWKDIGSSDEGNISWLGQPSGDMTITTIVFTGAGTPETDATPVTASSGTTIDPPSETASGGADDNLFIAWYASDEAPYTVTLSPPTGYTSITDVWQGNSSTSGGASGVAYKQSTSASDNPDTFTLANDGHVAWTMVIPPAAASSFTISSTQELGGWFENAANLNQVVDITATSESAPAEQTAVVSLRPSIAAAQEQAVAEQAAVLTENMTATATTEASPAEQAAAMALVFTITATTESAPAEQAAVLAAPYVATATTESAPAEQSATLAEIIDIIAASESAPAEQAAVLAVPIAGTGDQDAPTAEQAAVLALTFTIAGDQDAPTAEQAAVVSVAFTITATTESAPAEQAAALVEIFDINAAQETAPGEQAAAGIIANPIDIAGAQDGPPAEQAAVLVETIIATATTESASAEQAAAASIAFSLDGTQNAPAGEQSATLAETFTFTGVQTAGAGEQSATVSLIVVSTGDQDAPTAEQSATLDIGFTATGDQDAPTAEQAAAMALTFTIAAAQVSAVAEQSAAGSVANPVDFAGAQDAAPGEQSAAVSEVMAATSAQTAPVFEQASALDVLLSTTGAQTVAAAEQAGDLSLVIIGTAAQVQAFFEQDAVLEADQTLATIVGSTVMGTAQIGSATALFILNSNRPLDVTGSRDLTATGSRDLTTSGSRNMVIIDLRDLTTSGSRDKTVL